MSKENLKVDFNKVDFNKQEDINDIVSQLASAKTGKKIRINMKVVAISAAYFILSGLAVNVYLLIKLIF